MEEFKATEEELAYVRVFVRAMAENVRNLKKRELFLKKMKQALGEEGAALYRAAYGAGLYSSNISFQKIFAVKVLSGAEAARNSG